MATGTQKTEFDTDKFSFTKNSGGDEQTVGAYVVTKKDNLVLVHQTHALKHNEPTAKNNHTVAFHAVCLGLCICKRGGWWAS